MLLDPPEDKVKANWPGGPSWAAVGFAPGGVLELVRSDPIGGGIFLGLAVVLAAWSVRTRIGQSVFARYRLHRQKVAASLRLASQMTLSGQEVPWVEEWAEQVRQHCPERVAHLNPKDVTVQGGTFVSAGPDLDASSNDIGGECDACRAYQWQIRLFQTLRVKESRDWLPQSPVVTRLG